MRTKITYAIEPDEIIVLPNAKLFDVQKVGEALAAISSAHGGQLRPEDIVEARNPAHALHRHFEWDDAKAAHQHRLETARRLVRVIRVERGPNEMRRAYLNTWNDQGHRSYRTIDDIIASQSLKDQILEQAEEDLAAWQRRYSDLVEICNLVEAARVALRRRRGKTTPQPKGESPMVGA